jgi:23S rRNA pseudouridine955/2504/2580 synthase
VGLSKEPRGPSAASPDGTLPLTAVKDVAVAPDDGGIRLDRWFRRHYPDIPHARLEKWLRSGELRIDGRRATSGQRLQTGQIIRVPPHAPKQAQQKKNTAAVPPRERDVRELQARVLYSDQHILAIDKPAGLPVQGGTGAQRHLDGMLDAFQQGGQRPKLVHRLDRDTSGVLVLGRTASAASALARAFQSRLAKKVYWAIVVGTPQTPAGRIDLPLSKLPGCLGERVGPDRAGGARAVTEYRLIDRAGREAAWLALEPLTGRTHQLRVHCLALGTPILGDGKYGGASAFLQGLGPKVRLHLHARALRIPHPAGGLLTLEAPLPDDMRETWQFFGFATDERSMRAAGLTDEARS